MYTEFRTKTLLHCYERQRERDRLWGHAIGEKYVQAVDLLKAVDHPSDLGVFPQFRYHTLTANRKGEHAMELGYRARLIFTVQPAGDALVAWVQEVSTTHYEH